MRGTLFHSLYGAGQRRQGKEKSQREGEFVLRFCAGEEGGRRCLQSKAWTGGGRAVWVSALWIQSHDSLHCPARLPAFLAGPGFLPPAPLIFFNLPPDAFFSLQFHPFQGPPTLYVLYHRDPWSCGCSEDEGDGEQR